MVRAPAVSNAVNSDADRQQTEQASDDTRRRDNDHQVGGRQLSIIVTAVARRLPCRGPLTDHC